MWQKCPICNGTGRSCLEIYTNNTSNPCKTCGSKGIISELTGLPPTGLGSNDYKNTKIGNSGDFRDNCEQFEDK